MKAPTPAQLLQQQIVLDMLYVVDGRDDPEHPFYMTYSGLAIKYWKYWTDFLARQEDWANS